MSDARCDAMRRALEHVYVGEQSVEAESVLDKLYDDRWVLIRLAAPIPAHKNARAV